MPPGGAHFDVRVQLARRISLHADARWMHVPGNCRLLAPDGSESRPRLKLSGELALP